MSNNPAPPSHGPLPLLISVTGHRDLRPEAIPTLENRLREVLREIQQAHPHTPLVLVSPLADGSDRLAARVALQLGLRLHVILPMPRALYLTDFAEPSRGEFEQLTSKAEAAFEIPLAAGVEEHAIQQPGDARNQQYDAAGDYIARHAQILLALWDGASGSKPGGTADIVRRRLAELPRAATSRLHPPDPVQTGPVIQIVTPRQNVPVPANAFAVLHLLPKMAGHEPEPEATYARIFASIEHFNRDAVEQADSADVQRSRGDLFPDDKAAKLPPSLQQTRDCFATADVLAGKYQKQSLISLKWILAFAFGAVLIYEVFEQVLRLFAWAMISYPIALSVAFIIYYRARRQDQQNKYQDYRALAEGLRVQFFWRLVGRVDPVETHYLRKQRWEMNWIRLALRVSWSLQGGELDFGSAVNAPTLAPERLQWLREHWLDNQYTFFARRAAAETHKHEFLERLVRLGLIVGLLLSLVLGALFVTPHALPHSTLEWVENSHWAEGILIVLTSLPMLLAAVVHGYMEYRALDRQANQYKVMERLFATARLQWDTITRTESDDPGCAELHELIDEVGREALVENADWVMLRRDRPLEVPAGR